jgi:hypothetical protein
LNVSERTVRRAIARGELRAIKINGPIIVQRCLWVNAVSGKLTK